MQLTTEFKTIIFEIESNLRDSLKSNQDDPSLYNGDCGVSLFYYFLFKCTKEIKYKVLSKKFVEKAIMKFNSEMTISLSFSYGLSGLSWLLIFYKTENFHNYLDKKNQELIDNIIIEKLTTGNDRFIFDFFNGFIGYGVYLADRNSETSIKALEIIIQLLEKSKVNVESGCVWPNIGWDDFTNLEEDLVGKDRIKVKYNLGLAHGLPSIISFLILLHKKSIKKDTAKELIIESCNYLENLVNKNNSDTRENIIPTIIKENDEITYSRRLAWCYGSLSASCIIYKASEVLESKKLFLFAKKVANNATIIAIDSVGLNTVECGLCHGASGNAYIFNQLYKYFGDPKMKLAANIFFEKIVELRGEINFGSSGFSTIRFDYESQKNRYTPDRGLLNGTVGIGLVLLSYLYPEIEPTWDRCLLLS
jgi:lantibiotic modifying enzyme